MLLYLVRHGEAGREGDDAARGLTDKGFREVSLAAVYARDRYIKVNAIYHSGKRRAMQTAQIFSDHLKPGNGAFETMVLHRWTNLRNGPNALRGYGKTSCPSGICRICRGLPACYYVATRRICLSILKRAGLPACNGSMTAIGRWSG